MNDPAARLEIVRPAVPADLDAAVLAERWSNDTWLTGGSVLRVCWRELGAGEFQEAGRRKERPVAGAGRPDAELHARSREESMAVAFPGESDRYRSARNRLVDQEIELRRAMEAVAEARRGYRLVQ